MAGLDEPATEVVARVARAANLGAVLVVVAVLALAESRHITVFLASLPKQKKEKVLIERTHLRRRNRHDGRSEAALRRR